MANDFRARLEGLSDTAIKEGAPPLAIVLALNVELQRIAVQAAAEHDRQVEEVRVARDRLHDLRAEMLRANQANPNSVTQRWIRRLSSACSNVYGLGLGGDRT